MDNENELQCELRRGQYLKAFDEYCKEIDNREMKLKKEYKNVCKGGYKNRKNERRKKNVDFSFTEKK